MFDAVTSSAFFGLTLSALMYCFGGWVRTCAGDWRGCGKAVWRSIT